MSDRDGIYGEWFGTYLDECYGLKLLRTPPRCPNCNAFIERWHRSIREEMLDHTLVFVKRDLQRLVADYLNYYHYFRPHQSLDQDSPLQKHDIAFDEYRKIKRTKMVDGLVTKFQLAA